ncbi:MAG: recombinase family protein, partial [Deltaproteobacteria bacterium]|nr:recombinase family protein [Deltaproteobacteria bacterium]
RKALHRWVEERSDVALAEEFVDEGESAYAPADKRPGFCRMIAHCRKHPVDLILVHKLDRFSRNREESILFKSLLRKHGVTVKSITENYDPETPQGFLYEGMIEVINQFYSMNLATETMKGMRENAERGYHNGGQAPYGYRTQRVPDGGGREHSRLVLGPDEEVATVREIVRLAVEESRGAKTITQMLNQRGVKVGVRLGVGVARERVGASRRWQRRERRMV